VGSEFGRKGGLRLNEEGSLGKKKGRKTKGTLRAGCGPLERRGVQGGGERGWPKRGIDLGDAGVDELLGADRS